MWYITLTEWKKRIKNISIDAEKAFDVMQHFFFFLPPPLETLKLVKAINCFFNYINLRIFYSDVTDI